MSHSTRVFLPSIAHRPWLGLAAMSVLLSACGGGGSSTPPPPPPPSFSLDTSTLTYTAASPTAATPAGQPVTASVTGMLSGTLYILVTVSGNAVATVSNFSVSGASGQGTVAVNAPSALGIGTFNSTVTVRACLNDQTCNTGELSGSPRTVMVTYTISAPPVAATVMPHVVAAGVAGRVVIRGSGLMGTTSVSFGGTPATNYNVVSDTEVHAGYPTTLMPGNVTITLNSGAIASPGFIVVVGSELYVADTLNYPAAPDHILATVFDAQHEVLYVAAAMANPANNQVWSYVHSAGTWVAPQSLSIPNLRDLTLSPDGSQLVALTDTTVASYDVTNLNAAPTIVTPGLAGNGITPPFMAGIAFANDGNALLATGNAGAVGKQATYLYAPATGTFADLGRPNDLYSDNTGDGGYAPRLIASGDGSRVIATQTGLNGVFAYSSSTDWMGQFIQVSQPAGEAAAVDTAADRIVLTMGTFVNINDGGFNYLGTVPTLTADYAVSIINPQGTLLYVFTSDNMLWTFDLSTTLSTLAANGGYYTQVGMAVPQTLPTPTNANLCTAVTPDGATMFLAGTSGVAVVPAP